MAWGDEDEIVKPAQTSFGAEDEMVQPAPQGQVSDLQQQMTPARIAASQNLPLPADPSLGELRMPTQIADADQTPASRQVIANAAAMGLPSDQQQYAGARAVGGVDMTPEMIPHPYARQKEALPHKKAIVSGLSPEDDAYWQSIRNEKLNAAESGVLKFATKMLGLGARGWEAAGFEEAGKAADYLVGDVQGQITQQGPQGFWGKGASNVIESGASLALGGAGLMAAEGGNRALAEAREAKMDKAGTMAHVGYSALSGYVSAKLSERLVKGGPWQAGTPAAIFKAAAKELGMNELAAASDVLERRFAGVDGPIDANTITETAFDTMRDTVLFLGIGGARAYAAKKWASAHPQEAAALAASKGSPADFKAAGLPVDELRPSRSQRVATLEEIKAATYSALDAEAYVRPEGATVTSDVQAEVSPRYGKRIQDVKDAVNQPRPVPPESRQSGGTEEAPQKITPEEAVDAYSPQRRAPLPSEAKAADAPPEVDAAHPSPSFEAGYLKPKSGKVADKDVVSKFDIIKEAEKELFNGEKIEIGRMGLAKGAAGYFQRREEIIRVKGQFAGDLYVIAHEAMHKIDKRGTIVKNLPQHLRAEIGPLDYDRRMNRPSEGFAEYLAEYLTGDDAPKQAPQFTKYFETEILGKDKKLKASFEKLKAKINTYRTMTPEQQAFADRLRPKSKGIIERGKELIGGLGEETGKLVSDLAFDRLGRTEYAEFALGRKRGKPVSQAESAYEYQKHTRNRDSSIAEERYKYGWKNEETGEQITKGKTYIDEAFTDLDQPKRELFQTYRQAKGTLARLRQGKQGLSMGKDAAIGVIERIQKRPDAAQFDEALRRQGLEDEAGLQALVDGQVLSPDDAARIKASKAGAAPGSVEEAVLKIMRQQNLISDAEYEDAIKEGTYTGIQRVMGDEQAQGRGSGGKPVKGYVGSGRQIYDLDTTDRARTVMFTKAISKRAALEKLADLGESADGLGEFAHEVITYKKGDALGPNEVKLWRRGKERVIKYNKDLLAEATAAQAHDGPLWKAWDIVGIIPKAVAKAVKFGATGPLNIGFNLWRNQIRDTQTVLMNPNTTLKDMPKLLWDIQAQKFAGMKSVFSEMKTGEPGEFFRIADKLGIQSVIYSGADMEGHYKRAQEYAKSAEGKAGLAKVWDLAKKNAALFGRSMQVFEIGPRMAIAEAVLKRHGFSLDDLATGKKNIPDNVMQEARIELDNLTQDFSRGSGPMMELNKVAPYSNAGAVQGPAQELRRAGFKTWNAKNWDKAKIAKSFMRGALVYGAPTMALWAANKDEDWYKELPAWQRAGAWNIRLGGYTIPIPHPGLAAMLFAGGMESMANAAYQKEKLSTESESIGAAAMGAVTDTALQLTPTAAKLPLELVSNYDTFKKRDIVDERTAKGKLPEDQYYASTTGVSKSLGKALGKSPAKIEHVIRGTTGGLGTKVAEFLDTGDVSDLAGFKSAVSREYPASINDFYKQSDKHEQELGSAKLRGKAPESLVVKRRVDMAVEGLMHDLRAPIKDVRDTTERAKTEKYIAGLARAALGKPELKDYPNPFRSRGNPPHVQAVVDDYLEKLAVAKSNPKPEKVAQQAAWAEKRRILTAEQKALGISDSQLQAAGEVKFRSYKKSATQDARRAALAK